jgi:hypothetical protein
MVLVSIWISICGQIFIENRNQYKRFFFKKNTKILIMTHDEFTELIVIILRQPKISSSVSDFQKLLKSVPSTPVNCIKNE